MILDELNAAMRWLYGLRRRVPIDRDSWMETSELNESGPHAQILVLAHAYVCIMYMSEWVRRACSWMQHGSNLMDLQHQTSTYTRYTSSAAAAATLACYASIIAECTVYYCNQNEESPQWWHAIHRLQWNGIHWIRRMSQAQGVASSNNIFYCYETRTVKKIP
jgi:hypothetical protein